MIWTIVYLTLTPDIDHTNGEQKNKQINPCLNHNTVATYNFEKCQINLNTSLTLTMSGKLRQVLAL